MDLWIKTIDQDEGMVLLKLVGESNLQNIRSFNSYWQNWCTKWAMRKNVIINVDHPTEVHQKKHHIVWTFSGDNNNHKNLQTASIKDGLKRAANKESSLTQKKKIISLKRGGASHKVPTVNCKVKGWSYVHSLTHVWRGSIHVSNPWPLRHSVATLPLHQGSYSINQNNHNDMINKKSHH